MTTKDEEGPITSDDLAAWFGDQMPAEVARIVFDAPAEWTVGRVRREIRKLARQAMRSEMEQIMAEAQEALGEDGS